MFTSRDFVWMIVIPGLVGLVLSFAGTFIKVRSWTGPLAVALSFLIAFPLIVQSGRFSLPAIPPPTSMGGKGWLPVVALITLAVGLLDSFVRLPAMVRGLIVAICSAIALTLLLKLKIATWSMSEACEMVAVFAVVAAIWACVIEDAVLTMPVGSILTIWLIASICAVVLMMIATIESGQFCLVVATCGFANLPALIWKPAQNAIRGLGSTVSILLVSFLVSAHYTSELGTLQLLILLSPPIFLFLTRWLPIRLRPWQRTAVRIAVTLIPLAAALALATVRFHQEQQTQHEEELY